MEGEIIELSDDSENEEKKVKKKLKTIRKDKNQPKIQNFFEIQNKQNYFATYESAQLPAQVGMN